MIGKKLLSKEVWNIFTFGNAKYLSQSSPNLNDCVKCYLWPYHFVFQTASFSQVRSFPKVMFGFTPSKKSRHLFMKMKINIINLVILYLLIFQQGNLVFLVSFLIWYFSPLVEQFFCLSFHGGKFQNALPQSAYRQM